MAGRGFAPSGKRSRESDQKRDEAKAVKVEADGELHGPEIGPSPVFAFGSGETYETITEWPEATERWWNSWRRSPQASTFTDTDWDFLADTAVLHGYFWYGEPKHGAELRLRVSKFGATIEDRARLRMQVGKPAGSSEPAKPKPAPAQDRDAQILRLVQDAG